MASVEGSRVPPSCGDRFKTGNTLGTRSKLDDFDETGALVIFVPWKTLSHVDLLVESFFKDVNAASSGEAKARVDQHKTKCMHGFKDLLISLT